MSKVRTITKVILNKKVKDLTIPELHKFLYWLGMMEDKDYLTVKFRKIK
jgi:hypothetical protein